VFLAIDESGFELGGMDDHDVVAALRAFADLVFEIRVGAGRVYKCSLYYEFRVLRDLTIMDLLYRPDFPIRIDRDLRVRLQLAFDRSVNWDETVGAITTLDVFVGQEAILAPTIAYAYSAIASGIGVGCLAPPQCSGRSGCVEISQDGTPRSVWFVYDAASLSGLARACYEIEDVAGEDYFGRLARIAFPNLEFVDDLGRQFRRLAGRYRDVRPEVTRHLGALNDHHVAAFAGHPEPWTVSARMGALGGVDMSPESPGTRANHAAWETRRISYKGRELHCEWHLKLTPMTNRIHFHPTVDGLTFGPVVGILADHLPI
jgi:hypothetical protein